MWLFNKSGIRRQELRAASALRRAFDEAGNRKTITRMDRQLLGWSEAKYLTAVNPHARICWAEAVCQELSDFFDIDPEEPYPDYPLFLVTLVDKSCTTAVNPEQIDIKKFKRFFQRGLRGLFYLGMIEPALYVNVSKEADYSGKRCVSWHLHAVVWRCTRAEIKKRMKRLNDDGRYRPIADGLRGADWGQIKEADLGTVLGYVLDSPSNEYRIGKHEWITKDGEILFRLMSNKARARKGNLIKLFHLMKGLYLDELAMGGGEGVGILRRAKRRAFQKARAPSSDRFNRP